MSGTSSINTSIVVPRLRSANNSGVSIGTETDLLRPFAVVLPWSAYARRTKNARDTRKPSHPYGLCSIAENRTGPYKGGRKGVSSMTSPFEIIVVSADLENRGALSRILTTQGFDPICVSTLRECHEIFAERRVGLVFCDPHVTDGDYEELLSAYRLKDRRPRVVVTSTYGDWDDFKKAMRLGAFDVISVPCRSTDVEWIIIQAKRDERNRFRNAHGPSVAEPVRAAAAASGSAS
jgi:PleD family two-component response regulator